MPGNAHEHRRSLLKYAGATLLGLVSWPFARRAGADSGVFAGRFLREPGTVELPAGYYDPQAQLYMDAHTHTPMFVAQAGAAADKLSERELADLMKKEKFVSLDELQKRLPAATRGKSTTCTLTSLSTTGCCPIITDRQSDRIDDD